MKILNGKVSNFFLLSASIVRHLRMLSIYVTVPQFRVFQIWVRDCVWGGGP